MRLLFLVWTLRSEWEIHLVPMLYNATDFKTFDLKGTTVLHRLCEAVGSAH